MTYSVGNKGAIQQTGNAPPNNSTTTRGAVVADSCATNNGAATCIAVGINIPGYRAGGMHNAMSEGAQFLAQMPDGSTRWCVFDDRSRTDYPIIVPVSP